MAQALTADMVNSIVRTSLKQNLAYLQSMLDGVRVEIKVMREEVKKIPWEIEGMKEKINSLDSEI